VNDGPGLMSAAWTILRKDLRLELRTKESLTATAIFTAITFVLFHFGTGRNAVAGQLAAGIWWVTLLFAGALAINRLLHSEREQGGFKALLMAPIDRNSILLAKAGMLFVVLTVLEAIALPLYALLLLEHSPAEALPQLIPVLLLANLGIAAVGTLVAGLASNTRARELIVPLLSLPLMVPLLIGAARATGQLFVADPGNAQLGRWLALMALYDAVFSLIAYAVFDYLLED
jgi:heme exporter protein B